MTDQTGGKAKKPVAKKPVAKKPAAKKPVKKTPAKKPTKGKKKWVKPLQIIF